MEGNRSLCDGLLKWYAANSARAEELDVILSLGNGKSRQGLSLRAIDVFVTSVAKRRRGVTLADGTSLHASYRAALKAFGKRNFDIFQRAGGSTVEVPLPGGGSLRSTVAQLNFCRWMIRNGVLDVARNHCCDTGKMGDRQRDRQQVAVSVHVSLRFA